MPSLLQAIRAANGDDHEFCRQACRILVVHARDAGLDADDKTYRGYEGYVKKNRDFAVGWRLVADPGGKIAPWAARAFFVQKQTAKYSICGGNSHTSVAKEASEIKGRLVLSPFRDDWVDWIAVEAERMLAIVDTDYLASVPQMAERWAEAHDKESEAYAAHELEAADRSDASAFELAIRDAVIDVLLRTREYVHPQRPALGKV